MRQHLATLLAASSLTLLTACAVGPEYHVPAVSVPAHYKYALQEAEVAGSWQAAQPADDAPRGAWWMVFNDPALHALQVQAAAQHPSLQAAWARLQQGRALQQEARSGFFPQVSAGAGVSRERPSPVSEGLPADAATPLTSTWRADIGVSYELDLFGRVAQAVNSATADAARDAALYQSVLLMLQTDIAQGYFLLQALDAERSVHAKATALRSASYALVTARYEVGAASELAVLRARTELQGAHSQGIAAERRRALAENALAVLTGQSPAQFSMPFSPLAVAAIRVPAGLPSTLLERRPDIAAAERAMAAANARIGMAEAAFFPRLAITASGGFESAALEQLAHWSSRTFLLGPLLGGMLSLPLFDGGARQAQVDYRVAQYEEAVALYRQAVLHAFRDVEDGLASLQFLARQHAAQEGARVAARRAAELAERQYREGSISQLEVMDAERAFLEHQLAITHLEAAQASALVQLIRALGGGWQVETPVVAAVPAVS